MSDSFLLVQVAVRYVARELSVLAPSYCSDNQPINATGSSAVCVFVNFTCHLADAFIQSDLQLIRLSRRHTPWRNVGLRALLKCPTAVQISPWPHKGSNHRPCGSKSSSLTATLQAAPLMHVQKDQYQKLFLQSRANVMSSHLRAGCSKSHCAPWLQSFVQSLRIISLKQQLTCKVCVSVFLSQNSPEWFGFHEFII